MSLTTHIAEDVLELYSLGRLSEPYSAPLEEHLLVCPSCQERLEQADDFVRAFRMAVRETPPNSIPEARPWDRWLRWLTAGWRPVPVAAALAMAAFAMVMIAPRSAVPGPEVDVRLSALRGSGSGVVSIVDANQKLRLELDAKALNGGAYRVELADARGRQVWQSPAPVPIQNETVVATVARAVPAGLYWVRLYEPQSGQLVREYGLRSR
jgi:hypothetical protein